MGSIWLGGLGMALLLQHQMRDEVLQMEKENEQSKSVRLRQPPSCKIKVVFFNAMFGLHRMLCLVCI